MQDAASARQIERRPCMRSPAVAATGLTITANDPKVRWSWIRACLLSDPATKRTMAWFFEQDDSIDVPTLIARGQEIDCGMNGESLLISLVGTDLHKSACGFSLTRSPEQVFPEVTRVQKGLIQGVESYLRQQSPPPIAELIRTLRPS